MKTLSSEKENLLKSHICDLYESKCFWLLLKKRFHYVYVIDFFFIKQE